MKYSELLDLWIAEKKTEVTNSTYSNYMYTIKNRIIPRLGDMEIENITRKDIQNYIYSLSETLKKNTILNVTKVLHQAFLFALENGYLKDTPYKRIKIPKDKSVKEIKVFKAEDVEKILSVKNYSQQKRDIVNIAYRTGMRIGEILALKLEDINFAQNFLTVRRTLSMYNNGVPEISEPKTKSSRRRVDLDNKTIEIFNNIQKQNKHEYVFCKNDGTILSRQCVYHAFRRMCYAADIQYHSFHALRHTHASILLASGVHPKIVQERLGHAKISTTMDTYSHLIPGMQKVAVNVFNKI